MARAVRLRWKLAASLGTMALSSCSGDVGGPGPVDGGTIPPPVAPACASAAGGGSADVQAPTVKLALADRFEEGWLGSPAVADLDLDGTQEIVAARGDKLVVWTPAGQVKWSFATSGRMWSSPVVADLRGDTQLEVAFAARGRIHLLDAAGRELSGFPVDWDDELRGLAAGDVDGDGQLDVLAPTTNGGPGDVVNAWRASGEPLPWFPPLASGTSGCQVDERCYFAGAFDQNVGIGALDGQGGADVVVPHDNAYASTFHGTGVAFDAAVGFPSKKTPGVRYLHVLAEAQQGYAEDEHQRCRRTSPTPRRPSPMSTATGSTTWSCWPACRTPPRPTGCRAWPCGWCGPTAAACRASIRRCTSLTTSAGCGISVTTSSAPPTRWPLRTWIRTGPAPS